MTTLVLGTSFGKFLIGVAFKGVPTQTGDEISNTVVSITGANTTTAVLFGYLLLTNVFRMITSLVGDRYYAKYLVQHFKDYIASKGVAVNEICVVDAASGYWSGVLARGLLTPEQRLYGVDDYSNTGRYKIWHPTKNMALEGITNATFVSGKGDAVPFGNARFDLVHAPLLLGGLKSKEIPPYLLEMKRILKPGGIFCTTATWPFARFTKKELKKFGFKDFRCIHRFSHFTPITIIFAVRDESPILDSSAASVELNTLPIVETKTPDSPEKSNNNNDDGVDKIDGESGTIAIEPNADEKIKDSRDSLVPQPEKEEDEPPKIYSHLGLRVLILILTIIFMSSLCIVAYEIWPYLKVPDYPESQNAAYAQINSGLIAPFLGFVGFSIFQVWFGLRVYCEVIEPPAKDLFSFTIKMIIAQLVGCFVFNVIFWAPGLIVELLTWKASLPAAGKSGISAILTVTIILSLTTNSGKARRRFK
eukprot:TRINITY_DN337_c1_g1_i3.p1 TRINITY_DN337_c1_g1~~TRINITY_DN337_c1_g1_i3.p1  ORF type:complete len:476 (-),score=96.74 TRINITY_DN337_c1_g1_i3:130-1557(-)